LCELIQKLHRSEGVGILLVSQQMEDIYRLTDYFSTLKSNGRLTKFQRPEMAYFKLTSPAEAKRFGCLNEVEWQGQHYYFRPNQYEITANGIPLEVVRVVFNGYIFEHFCRFENQEVILYALNHLPQEFKILPTVV
jgi:ABC-type sulfate/molybdate transport systems ATPase subunit